MFTVFHMVRTTGWSSITFLVKILLYNIKIYKLIYKKSTGNI